MKFIRIMAVLALALTGSQAVRAAEEFARADRRHLELRGGRSHRAGRQEVVSVRRDAERHVDLHRRRAILADSCRQRPAEDRQQQPADRHAGGICRDHEAQHLGVRDLRRQRGKEDRHLQDRVGVVSRTGRARRRSAPSTSSPAKSSTPTTTMSPAGGAGRRISTSGRTKRRQFRRVFPWDKAWRGCLVGRPA